MPYRSISMLISGVTRLATNPTLVIIPSDLPISVKALDVSWLGGRFLASPLCLWLLLRWLIRLCTLSLLRKNPDIVPPLVQSSYMDLLLFCRDRSKKAPPKPAHIKCLDRDWLCTLFLLRKNPDIVPSLAQSSHMHLLLFCRDRGVGFGYLISCLKVTFILNRLFKQRSVLLPVPQAHSVQENDSHPFW